MKRTSFLQNERSRNGPGIEELANCNGRAGIGRLLINAHAVIRIRDPDASNTHGAHCGECRKVRVSVVSGAALLARWELGFRCAKRSDRREGTKCPFPMPLMQCFLLNCET